MWYIKLTTSQRLPLPTNHHAPQYPSKVTTSVTRFGLKRSTSSTSDITAGSSSTAAVNVGAAVTTNTTYPLQTFHDYKPDVFANTNLPVVQLNMRDMNGEIAPMRNMHRVFQTGTLVVASVSLRMWKFKNKRVCTFFYLFSS